MCAIVKMDPDGRGIIVGDDRLFPWRLEAPFRRGGGRPDKMISRVTEGEGGESGK